MVNKFVVTIVALIAILGMVVPGCGAPTEPEPEPRTTGAFLDEILITEEATAAAAITKLERAEIDVYATSSTDRTLFDRVKANPDLAYLTSVGLYYEISFNPVLTFTDGRLNPFGVAKIREAMNWLVDRKYIADEIMGGLAVPKFTCLSGALPDAKVRYPDLVKAIETEYAFNTAKANATIHAEMLALNATLVGGKWHHGGAPIEITCLIRTEDARLQIGHYFADRLEAVGFTVKRQTGTAAMLGPIWLAGDPKLGAWHTITGGWVTTTVSRDQGSNFGFFYTKLGRPELLWQSYINDPAFYTVAEKLWNNAFTTMAERRALFAQAFPMAMKESQRIFLIDNLGFWPIRKNVGLAADGAGGISGSWMWGPTIHFKGADGKPTVGGIARIAMPSMLPQPPNPIAGSNWVFDMFWIRATGDVGVGIDTRDGLRWPSRITKAEVVVKEGLPVGVTHDWCKLTFAPEIEVPADAWADWNAVTQKFITVRERFGLGKTTALRKSVAYYPKDIFSFPLHDGSTLSMGDFILYTILQFDRAKPESPIYDATTVPAFRAFIDQHKGVKFITDDPNWGLIVETYSDFWTMDAELNVSTWFPVYSQGPGVWHTIALGIKAEIEKSLAFGSAKATTLGVEWMSFIGGPSIPILRSKLESARRENYIPYAPTMGTYVTTEEAAQRYANLAAWSAPTPEGKGHFWVAMGPFYLEAAYPLTKVVHLKRFEAFPDKMDKWLFLLQPLS